MSSAFVDLALDPGQSRGGGGGPATLAALNTLERFGYGTVCFTAQEAAAQLPSDDRCALAVPLPTKKKTQQQHTTAARASSPPRQLTRVTISVGSAEEVAAIKMTSAATLSYDLVALKPVSDEAFTAALEAENCGDLIVVGGCAPLPFMLRPGPVEAAVKRGTFFELHYAPALCDATARRHFISNALDLARATRGGRNVVFSSGPATSHMDLRGPLDVVNLAMLCGLGEAAARNA
eukprot:g6341.t1